MHRQSMTLEEANAVCRARAREYAAEYLQVVESARGRDDLCRDAKSFLDALRLGISGNIAWGLQCPRYHTDRKLTQAQLDMGRTVWADEAIGWHHVHNPVANGVDGHSAVETNGAIENNGTVETNGTVVNGVRREDVAAVRDVPALGTEVSTARIYFDRPLTDF
jgi:fusicocca-2,10(14)-diene synthase/ophiobolin F synthase